MFRFSLVYIVAGSIAATSLLAQSPAAAPSTASPAKPAGAAASSQASPAASASLSSEQLINSLTTADLQAAVSLLKANFTKPEAINETDLSRATLEGLMVRLGPGLMLLPNKSQAAAEPAAPSYGEILENHIGYLRPGSLNNANLQAMDKKLIEFSSKKVDALIIDLRSSSSDDFTAAADFAKRFCAKGKTLFTLRKAGKQDRTFTSDRDPTYQGLTCILIDGDTGGGAEALAAAVRALNKTLTIGQPTAGRAVEYSDLPLPSGKILRVAISEAATPHGESLYPQGLKPDLPVEMSMADKRQIFQLSMDKGMGAFVYETERPHLNEAALIAGTNPELESAEQRRNRGFEKIPRDGVLQRAMDLITSLEIFQRR
jgi:hypothetical protein